MKRCLTLTISDTANLITRWRHIVKICSIGAITWYWMSKNLYWSDLHQLSAHSMHGLACETLERTPGLPGYNEKLLSKLENQRDTECRRHGSRKFDWILCSLAPGSVHTKLLESTISGGRRLCGKYCFGKMVMTLLNFKAFLHSRLQSIVVMFSLSTYSVSDQQEERLVVDFFWRVSEWVKKPLQLLLHHQWKWNVPFFCENIMKRELVKIILKFSYATLYFRLTDTAVLLGLPSSIFLSTTIQEASLF